MLRLHFFQGLPSNADKKPIFVCIVIARTTGTTQCRLYVLHNATRSVFVPQCC